MKLNQKDTQTLRNFANINPSIQFQEGNILRTMSPNKTIMAKAMLDTNVESTFAIYDLSRFLGVISMFEDPNFELEESRVNISTAGRKVSYTYADPSIMVLPPNKDINIGDADVQFELKAEQYSEIIKALGVMSFPDLIVVGENGKIILRATDSKNPSSDKYDIEVGETDLEFTAIFKSENMKIVPNNYKVHISSKGISHFVSENIEYWIAVENNSKF